MKTFESMYEKIKNNSLVRNMQRVFRRTSLEILVGLVIGGFAGGVVSGHYESARNNKIPLGFSEITQLEKEAEKENPTQGVGAITHFYASTNDICMKVFEAWNLTNKKFNFDFDNAFAKELEYHVDPTFKTHHYNLKSFFGVIQERATNAFNKLGQFVKVNGKMNGVNSSFDASWSHSSVDTTHQECHEVESCSTDSEGNQNCTTHEECHTVCDYTTHYFTYHKEDGEKSSKLLDLVLIENKDLHFPEELRIVKQTNAEGEYASETSREDKEVTFSDKAKLLKIANTWNFGSTYNYNKDEIMSLWKNLHSDSDNWRRDKETAHDESFVTCCGCFESPKEYDTAEKALSNGRNFSKLTDEIIGGIEYIKSTAPKLDKLIDEYIGATLDNKEGKPKKLRKEIMKTAKEMYQKNFKEGFEVDRFRWSVLFLSILLGGGTGAGIGYLIDRKTSSKFNRGFSGYY